MRVLHVVKDCPYPPTNGIRSDIWHRLVAMCRLGCRVHVVITTRGSVPGERELAEVRKIADKVDLVPREITAGAIFTRQPILVATNRSLKSLLLEEEYDLALADSELMAPIFDNPRLRAKLRVVRVHNDETRYYRTLAKAEERPLWKAFFALESLRFRRFSPGLFDKVDGLWFISESERDRIALESANIGSKSFWLPPAIDLCAYPRRARLQVGSREVLIVGGLKGPLNREGIRWYIRHVHPILRQDDAYRLTIAGSTGGSKKARSFVAGIADTERCEVHVDRADLSPLYSRASVMVNPMQSGAGVKLKTIHAALEGRPLVTTSVGAEGSGLKNREHIRVEDDPARFAAAIREIFERPDEAERMTDRAYQFLREQYDQAAHIRRFLSERLDGAFDVPTDALTSFRTRESRK